MELPFRGKGQSRGNNPSIKPPSHQTTYPEPFVVAPSAEHKQTLILLHGRGDIGQTFGLGFLFSPLSPATLGAGRTTVQARLPTFKFVFPTAKKRRAKWYNRAVIHQWFDNVPIDEQDSREMTADEELWQLEGLRETREFLKTIVDTEVELVGAENVFIGGLSQGCAISLHFFLSYQGSRSDDQTAKHLGGFIGMSGWLPFVKHVERILQSGESLNHVNQNEGVDNPFAPSESDADYAVPSIAVQACNYIRDNMDLAPIANHAEPLYLSTPVFLGHGVKDERVKIARGRKVAEVLLSLGVQDVSWKEYDEGHWYKRPEELDDIVAFMQKQLARR